MTTRIDCDTCVVRGLACHDCVVTVLLGPPPELAFDDDESRALEVLAAHGLKAQGIVYCDPTAAGGQTAAAQLLAETPDIDALICYNDLNAIGAMKASRAAGISIPGQIALIGFDDIPAAELLSPALTTLRVQKREMGEEAVRLLLSRITTKNRQHGIVIVPELIIRETT